jgi:hypothetical protein
MKKTIPVLLLVILFGGAAWYSFTRQPEPIHELPAAYVPPVIPVKTQQPDSQLEAVIENREPLPEPEPEPEPLPPLNESDAGLTLALTDVFGAAQIANHLVKDQAISRLVSTIDRLTSRQVPPQINPLRPVEDTFQIETEGENLVMSTQNFLRYDSYIELIRYADSTTLVGIYQNFSPLFQQAWEENGGEGSFEKRLDEVIDHLLETPDIPGPVYLTKPEAVYLFADSDLEAMTAGQKVLVRMGSANAAIVKDKLTEIRAGLNP